MPDGSNYDVDPLIDEDLGLYHLNESSYLIGDLRLGPWARHAVTTDSPVVTVDLTAMSPSCLVCNVDLLPVWRRVMRDGFLKLKMSLFRL